jgi:hypothetical protein
MFPHCRLLREYVVAVQRLPLGRGEKLRCHLLVAAQLRWRWKALLREAVVNAALATGVRRIGLPGRFRSVPRSWGSI